MNAVTTQTVTFIQYDEPPLKAGEYTISVGQKVNQSNNNEFSTSVRFAVAGQRFLLNPADIVSVFPPDLANGEYTGALPQVVFSRRTLPWERPAISSDKTAPWLAVLTFDTSNVPSPSKVMAKDLVPAGQTITDPNSKAIGTGTLPANYFSYPGLAQFDYGESADDVCTVIDVPVALFNQIAPSAADLPFLADVRETDTSNAEDNEAAVLQYAIVLGNRVGQAGDSAWPFLVSLENLGPYLPNADGLPSGKIPAGVEFIRLLTYRYWRYFSTTSDETLKSLLENLNKNAQGQQGLSTLQVPFSGAAPDAAQVQQALADQAAGTLTSNDATVLVVNALGMGFVPMDHALREAGQTVSWYRSPLAPLAVKTTLSIPQTCPDALNRYNPQTGMFDVSYGAAWQIGQLLALQNNAFAVTLYEWKKTLGKGQAAAEEQVLIEQKLNNEPLLESFIRLRASRLADRLPPIPEYVATWIGRLRLLYGIPFQYLAPDECMLPVESIRFFSLDENWMEAIIDGAFSIGRATGADAEKDSAHVATLRAKSIAASKLIRRNPRPAAAAADESGVVSGFLLRSLAVSGWSLRVDGYADTAGTKQLPLLRMARLSDSVLLCLFDGAVQMVAVHEPPEQLHSGVEFANGQYTTTLRAVTGATPGQQFLTDPHGGPATAVISTRSDGQTLQIAAGAASIENKLNTDFSQNITLFTSAEFALEMAKGVVKVEFLLEPNS
jgi:hypothetical protein